jgi:hypothetical protein
MSFPREDKFSFDFAEIPAVQCWLCRHAGTLGDIPACAAFPAGIPRAIRDNLADHRRPYLDPATGEPDDTGVSGERSITFEPADGVNPAALRRLYEHLDGLPPR